ncbi:MAG TPA: ABC transporter ATP-binding protein [Acetobacteraceae bacterium]|nr:ABC transporter ATP-binding protein [Acetobacteraceae bacterium]
MPEPLLDIRGLCKRFGGLRATDDVSLTLFPGEIHAVIGPNGAGKTTLIAQIAGELAPDSGQVLLDGAEITRLSSAARAARGLVRSFQITSVFPDFSALDNVALAVQAHAGHSFRFWRPAARDPALREPARARLAEMGLAARADVPAGALSHGERRTLELAMALAAAPRALLLDEPLAGMGPEESAQMIRLLAGLKGRFGVLLVEHDMDAVFALADRVSVLEYGRVIAAGTPEEVRRDPLARAAYLGEDEAA